MEEKKKFGWWPEAEITLRGNWGGLAFWLVLIMTNLIANASHSKIGIP